MKSLILICLFLMIVRPVAAQDIPIPAEAEVTKVYDVETPPYYIREDISVVWSEDGSMFAVRFDHRGRDGAWIDILWQVYDTATGEILHSFKNTHPYLLDSQKGEERYFSLTLAGDAENTVVLTLDVQNSLRIYNAITGQLQFSMEDVTSFPLYSPNGQLFMIDKLSDEVLRIYDAADFTLRDTLDGFHAYLWSPDSSMLTVSSSVVESPLFEPIPYFLWKPADNMLIPLDQRTDTVLWSQDAKSIGSSSTSNEIRLYDAGSGQLTDTLDDFTYGRVRPLLLTAKYLVLANYGAHYSTTIQLNIWDRDRKEFVFSTEVTGSFDIRLEENELWLLELTSGLRHVTLTEEPVVEQLDFERTDRLHFVSPDWRWFVMDSVTWSPDSQHFAAYEGNYYKVSIWQVVEQ